MRVDAKEDILQRFERIYAQCLADAQHTVQHGRTLCCIVTACEHKILSDDGNGTDRVLHLVIVNVE